MKLHLFTATYPTGFGESFLNNELPSLAKEFDEVILYPFDKKDVVQTAFDGKQKVVYHTAKNSLSFADYLLILRVMATEFFNIKQKKFFITKLRRWFATLKKSMQLANWIAAQQLDTSDAFYSFWMNEWALALALQRKRDKTLNFIFRINGYDIHDDRHEGNYMPFKYFIHRETTKIIPLSKTSCEYVKKRTKFPEKVTFNYYGTKDFGWIAEQKNEVFTIFSCSGVIPLKRIDKMARVIQQLPFPVKWVHHGDGPSLADVLNVVKTFPNSVEFVHSKRLANYFEVLQLQKRLAPDLFINLSTTEGLPVTIMEAQSFGTPILVNNCGSCQEFITPFTGILVDVNESPEEIAKKITKFEGCDRGKHYPRERIRKFWEDNFSAEKNYTRFAHEIKDYFNGIKR